VLEMSVASFGSAEAPQAQTAPKTAIAEITSARQHCCGRCLLQSADMISSPKPRAHPCTISWIPREQYVNNSDPSLIVPIPTEWAEARWVEKGIARGIGKLHALSD